MTSDSAGVPGRDAIVLAGGRGSRLGGVDKAEIELAGQRLVDRAVRAAYAAGALRVIVVGPAHTASLGATTVREDPPFGGPLAALAAALPLVEAAHVLLLACDLEHPDRVCDALVNPAVWAGNTPPTASNAAEPSADAQIAARNSLLPAAARDGDSGEGSGSATGGEPDDSRDDGRDGMVLRDGVVLRDGTGRLQWLAGCYRVAALREHLSAAEAAAGIAGGSLRSVLGLLDLRVCDAPDDALTDIDEPSDLARSGARVRTNPQALP